MPETIRRVIDQFKELGDVEWPYSNNQVPKYNSSTGKFEGASAAGGSDANYVHIQNGPTTVWTVVHNLGKYCSIVVVDSANTVVEGDIVYDSINQATLTFSAAFGGKAYCN